LDGTGLKKEVKQEQEQKHDFSDPKKELSNFMNLLANF
jgi:hypothetical protein